MIPLYWLSFVNENGFAGVCIVRAEEPLAAIKESWARNCNPGGAVQMQKLTTLQVHESWLNKLLPRATVEANEASADGILWTQPAPEVSP